MLNKKILLIIGVLIVVFLISGFFWPLVEGETLVKEGVLTDVVILDDTTITLSFNDGEQISVKEDNLEDTTEMHEYLTNLIGQNITIEYTYHSDIRGYEIDSVIPEQV